MSGQQAQRIESQKAAKVKASSTLKAALKSAQGSRQVLFGALACFRKHPDGNLRLVLVNLLKDFHCRADVMSEFVSEQCSSDDRGALSEFVNPSEHSSCFSAFCECHTLAGEPINLAFWGAKCFRLVPLVSFAELARSRIIDIEHLSTEAANLFLRRVRMQPEIADRERALELLRDICDLDRIDRQHVFSKLPLGRGTVVWVTNSEELLDVFAEGNVPRVRLAARRLGLACPTRDFLLLFYPIIMLEARKLRLVYPTCFDCGIDQGLFKPSRFDHQAGLTQPETGELEGLPEAVHHMASCDMMVECPRWV